MASNGGFGSTGDSAYFCVTPADCYVFGWTTGSWADETSWTFNGVSGSSGLKVKSLSFPSSSPYAVLLGYYDRSPSLSPPSKLSLIYSPSSS